MKPLALSLALSANLVAVLSFGQVTYSHYLDETSQWHVRHSSVYFNSVCNSHVLEVRNITMFFDGDTTLNGQAYYKLFLFRQDSIICGNSFTLANSMQYVAAIREDSTKRVYFYTSSGDQLLWNFNISIGDWIGNFCLVTNIDTVWLGNFPLQRYLCHCDVNNYMVEGVGLSPIISFNSLCTAGVESSMKLICYSRQNHTLQFDSIYSCNLQPVTGLAPVEKNNAALIDIFPNPGRDEVFLRLHAPLIGDAPVRIRLINGTGQTVISAQGAGAMHRLDISTLPKGLYVVEVVSAGAHITKQMLKQ